MGMVYAGIACGQEHHRAELPSCVPEPATYPLKVGTRFFIHFKNVEILAFDA